ncbi:MAG: AIM24 family protein, partial [Anaerotignaceae bacterium]
SFPGTIIPVELRAGESVICQKRAFMAATKGVELSVFFNKSVGKGLFGGEGFVMQKITGPGTAFLEIDGHCVEYNLAAGEKLTCDTGVLAIMDETCTMDIVMVKGVKNMLFGGEGAFDTVVSGPGKVYLQTMTIENLANLIIPFVPSKG